MKAKVKVLSCIRSAIVYLMGVIFLAPLLISVLMAFKSKQETMKGVLSIPETFHFENFKTAIRMANIWVSMKNSFIVTSLSVVIVIIVASMAGYGIARMYKNKFFRAYELVLLGSMMIPFQTLMIPIYKMMKSLGLMNTRIGALILIAGFNMPFAIIMFIGFVRTIPIEMEEAAFIDGCSRIKIFQKIVLPLLRPIVMTVSVLDSLWAWNEFNISFLILQKESVKTIPIQQYVFFGEHSANYNMAFAAAVISMIPIVIFFMLSQKYIIAGITAGAVKG